MKKILGRIIAGLGLVGLLAMGAGAQSEQAPLSGPLPARRGERGEFALQSVGVAQSCGALFPQNETKERKRKDLCPQITQMGADTGPYFCRSASICVDLRAHAFSLLRSTRTPRGHLRRIPVEQD